MKRLVPGPVRRLRHRLRALDHLGRLDDFDRVAAGLDQAREALGRIEARQLDSAPGPLSRHEFRVYSHAGEDGVIQFLTRSLPIANRRFVEFGVEDYREANTRFLLVKDYWTGLILDGDPANIARIKSDPLFWNADLKAEAAFVTRENVNDILTTAGFTGDIGLLSVDVDGNDYWIFDAITVARPVIAIVEYNHRFGPSRSVTIPYDPGFVRLRTDWTWHFGGASLAAIVGAAARKGLSFVGCNTFGNNAFFVRTELLPAGLPALTAEQGFVPGRFREAIIRDGAHVAPTPDDERRLMDEATLVDVP